MVVPLFFKKWNISNLWPNWLTSSFAPILARFFLKYPCSYFRYWYFLNHTDLLCYQLKYHFNIDNSSIADNYIYQISLNEKGDICLATNNGISIINFGSPLLSIGKSNNVYGAGYSSYLKGNEMYLGTSQGLFHSSDWENTKKDFKQSSFCKW